MTPKCTDVNWPLRIRTKSTAERIAAADPERLSVFRQILALPVPRAPSADLLLRKSHEDFLLLIARRGMFIVAMLPAIFIGLAGFLDRDKPGAPKPQPRRLEFELVAERYGQLRLASSRAEVELLLGRPSPWTWEPEFAEWREIAEHCNRHWSPAGARVWTKWTDPRDRNRWVAVLFAKEMVYAFHKKGF
jgi:hypothetical protein